LAVKASAEQGRIGHFAHSPLRWGALWRDDPRFQGTSIVISRATSMHRSSSFSRSSASNPQAWLAALPSSRSEAHGRLMPASSLHRLMVEQEVRLLRRCNNVASW